MTDHHPADRPGHLDIDAVSAFVDRDFEPDDLTTIEFHLHNIFTKLGISSRNELAAMEWR